MAADTISLECLFSVEVCVLVCKSSCFRQAANVLPGITTSGHPKYMGFAPALLLDLFVAFCYNWCFVRDFGRQCYPGAEKSKCRGGNGKTVVRSWNLIILHSCTCCSWKPLLQPHLVKKKKAPVMYAVILSMLPEHKNAAFASKCETFPTESSSEVRAFWKCTYQLATPWSCHCVPAFSR